MIKETRIFREGIRLELEDESARLSIPAGGRDGNMVDKKLEDSLATLAAPPDFTKVWNGKWEGTRESGLRIAGILAERWKPHSIVFSTEGQDPNEIREILCERPSSAVSTKIGWSVTRTSDSDDPRPVQWMVQRADTEDLIRIWAYRLSRSVGDTADLWLEERVEARGWDSAGGNRYGGKGARVSPAEYESLVEEILDSGTEGFSLLRAEHILPR